GATCTFIGQKGTSTSINIEIEAAGLYELIVRYVQPYDKTKKVQYLNVNDTNQGEVSFPYTLEWKEMSSGIVKLNEGNNNIEFESYWGYTFFDYVIVKPADESITNLSVDKTLVNPNSTEETKSLISYLADVYGKNILSGQQELCGAHNYEGSEAEFTYIQENTGELPAVRGFDFMNYRGNDLVWDDYCAERVIEWYDEKGGIPTVCWHWFSPGDIGKSGDSSFYTENTSFSISKALTSGTKENIALLNDIDFMAEKFKQVQAAGVPVLFRPLHEAEGAWFWWGAEGPEPCVELYRLIYDKFTNEHGLNNIIWVWTSYDYETSPQWYPGDDVVDIIGYDKYNAKDGLPNGSAISSTFYNLVKFNNGTKMVAMSENDTIPQVSSLIDEMAGWLYFCPWYGWWLTSEQNNPVDWLIEIYQSDYCITLDELPNLKTYSTSDFTSTPTSTNSTETTSATTTPTLTPSPTDDKTTSPTTVTIEPTITGDDTDEDYTINYSSDNWSNGATVTVEIINNTSVDKIGWSLNWTFPSNQQITNLWSGKYTQDGSDITVTNEEWNDTILANSSISFGFNMSFAGENIEPTDFNIE
ncbi:MAG: glycosyl hydrolase, partial [Clostridiales bacterium]